MAIQKPSIPKGTRDFSPLEMLRRNHIFSTIRSVFEKYGFQPLETPSMENLSTLTGKYGDEGDQLIFKILNSGDYLSKADLSVATEKGSKSFTPLISEKALRYDLTVPFARYVVMHQNEITFPFKRYQIQPVWRADRPQRGRYREFYQCDADVVGSNSLINEAELVLIYDEALTNLGLTDFTIKINNRKVLAGIAEIIGKTDQLIPLTVAIDKLDKVGIEGVKKELRERDFSEETLSKLEPLFLLSGDNSLRLGILKGILAGSEIGKKGIEEIEILFSYLGQTSLKNAKIELDLTLARGLNYYTGAIFEVKAGGVSIGSIGGGGRYDDLTGIFGLPGISGVGVSFGADRIYDVLEELNLFGNIQSSTTKILFCALDEPAEKYCFSLTQKIREQGISAEVFPDLAKLKKQLGYADNKKIPYTVVVGSNEMQSGLLTLRNMTTGEQQQVRAEEIAAIISKS